MKTLEEILQEYIKCKKPFLKNPYYDDKELAPVTMTTWGSAAYGKLISLLYDIGELTEIDVNNIVDVLDNIVSEI